MKSSGLQLWAKPGSSTTEHFVSDFNIKGRVQQGVEDIPSLRDETGVDQPG